VELSLKGKDVVFSDNYFPLPAGRKVQITCPFPSGWNEKQVKEALHVRSVYDSYSTERMLEAAPLQGGK
jgi:beta-mannosidase